MNSSTLTPPPPSGPPPAVSAPVGPDHPSASLGLKPTPDPTRTGALWVGGAGVALLLAAAAVLTAVRWDEIGQSAKLGGLAVITLAMLWAGHRLRAVIPMTAQAIFHLGALLIPFDMAAVSTLAGQPWQQTLLVSSLTSVLAWYGIERVMPSRVLRVSAHLGVIATAAGIAAVSPVSMPLLLAVAAIVAVASRQVEPAALWAGVAGVLPIAALMTWPPRIAGGMIDLGFDGRDTWQPLAAGVLSVVAFVGLTRLVPRIELAWSAVLVGALTFLLALNGFADVQISYLSLAGMFLGLEALALVARDDELWRPVANRSAQFAELATVCCTLVVAAFSSVGLGPSNATVALAAGFCALGWLTADMRRLDGSDDPLLSLLVGSDWWPTTIMTPVSVLGMVLVLHAPYGVSALVAICLAYWMVSTWRTGALIGAHMLAVISLFLATQTGSIVEASLGAAMALVFVLSSRLELRVKHQGSSVVAAASAVGVWLIGTGSVLAHASSRWPLAVAIAGAWITSMLIDQRRGEFRIELADVIGRLAALAIAGVAVWVVEPVAGLILCATIVALIAADFARLTVRKIPSTHSAFRVLAFVAGAAVASAGVPFTVLLDVPTATGGVILACASIVTVGLALALPERFGIPLGAATVVLAGSGLLMASIAPGAMAIAVMAVGAGAMLVGASLRDLLFVSAGYVALAVGFSLQLSLWNVEWIEPYLVLPALGVLAVGHQFHKSGLTSWLTYAPVVAVLSYVALADRFTGGSAWHSVIAGAVGVLAVLAGGYRRLAGPLISGTAVLAVVAIYESLGSAGSVPTWGWLALGGTVLLASGIALERSDTTPLQRTQQLRHVVATQFS